MKKRNGFVSNSSSSSFLMVVKRGLDKTKIRELLKTKMRLTENSFAIEISNRIIECIIRKLKETSITKLKEDSFEDGDYYDNITKKFQNLNVDIYEGRFCDDSGNSIETFLCEESLNFEDEDLYFEHEGGY
jgi:hypothetical protein